MKKMLSKIKYITLRDIIGIFKFLLVLIPALIYKIYLKIVKKELWLICEQENTARDNGYHFFKYMCEKHSEIKCIYAIDYNSLQYLNIKEIGLTVNWNSLFHYFYYMSATKNISAHKDGNPNQLVFTFTHLYLNLFNNRVFLQHGIIKDDIPMFHYKNTKFIGFICGGYKEYEFIRNTYGYQNNEVWYTGLARYDKLHEIEVNKKQILIIPTWRNWLGRDTNILGEKINFENTDYFKNWSSVLNNKMLISFIEENDIIVKFYPHIQMQKYINFFETKSKNIKIVSFEEQDIQALLKESALMITDFSSVFFDFGYMNKPVIYFHFDYEEFRRKQLQEGYFSYEKDGFGPVAYDGDKVIESALKYIKNNYKVEKKYLNRVNDMFVLKDKKNCERIYQKIIDIK